MPSPFQLLKTKIIVFQKKILEQQAELQQLKEKSDKEMRQILLEQIEWLDALSILSEDLKAQPEPDHSAILKSTEYLKRKMQRFFKANAIEKINPSESSLLSGDFKVIETRPELGQSDGTVLEIIREGYKWKDEVLRKAEVVTVKN